MASSQHPGTVCGSPHCARTGTGGTAIGGSADIGRHVTSVLSVAFEFSIPARFTSVQVIPDLLGSRTRIENAHRDIVLSGVLHLRAVRTRRAQFELVGGGGLVRQDTLQRQALGPSVGLGGTDSDFGPYGPQRQRTEWTFGVSGGGDLTIAVSRRVGVVPQMRVHFVSRDGPLSGTLSGNLGLSSWVVRPGVSVRVGF